MLADLFTDVDHSDKPGQVVNNFQKSSHNVVVVIKWLIKVLVKSLYIRVLGENKKEGKSNFWNN